MAAAVGAQMAATQAAFKVNVAQSARGQEQDVSAVILEMDSAHAEAQLTRSPVGSRTVALGGEVN
jgi:hypothetical protein